MKCNKCGSEWKTDPTLSASLTVCPFCQAKIVAEKSGDWKYFDNTKELLEYVAAEYGNDALFGRKCFSDHTSPTMPQGQKNLVKQAFDCGSVKILQDSMTADQQSKEIAVKQAVKKLTDLMFSKEAAERVIWEFTNAIGWDLPEPNKSSSGLPRAQSESQPNTTAVKSTNSQRYDKSFNRDISEENAILDAAIITELNRINKLNPTYIGESLDGRRHGKGKATWPNGDWYEGDWKCDEPHGQGTQHLVFDDGNSCTYVGKFSNGQRHGKGKLTWPSGAYYDGDWRDGYRHGYGEYKGVYNDTGEVYIYVGSYSNGNWHGKGKITNANGNWYEGDFYDGKKQGKGIEYFFNKNGDNFTYEGDFLNGNWHGHGKMIDSDGGLYEGGWHENKRHGKGKVVLSANDWYEGIWEKGELKKTVTRSAKYRLTEIAAFLKGGAIGAGIGTGIVVVAAIIIYVLYRIFPNSIRISLGIASFLYISFFVHLFYKECKESSEKITYSKILYGLFSIVGLLFLVSLTYLPNIYAKPINVISKIFTGQSAILEQYYYQRGFFGVYSKTGEGKYIWPNGCWYEGDLLNGVRIGTGTEYVIFDSGLSETYTGDFVDGVQQGKGKLKWSDGDIYEGDFVDGIRTGKGRYVTPDDNYWYQTNPNDNLINDSEDSDFVDESVGDEDLIDDAEAPSKSAESEITGWVYVGDFYFGRFHGNGRIEYNNGNTYEGGYIDGTKHGMGVENVINSDGTIWTFTGEFRQGSYHEGVLVITLLDGSTTETTYVDGVRIEE